MRSPPSLSCRVGSLDCKKFCRNSFDTDKSGSPFFFDSMLILRHDSLVWKALAASRGKDSSGASPRIHWILVCTGMADSGHALYPPPVGKWVRVEQHTACTDPPADSQAISSVMGNPLSILLIMNVFLHFNRIHHGHHGVHDHPGSGSPASRESIGVDPLLFGMIMSVNLLTLGLATPL